jgi:hypothetical protein
MEKLTRQEAFSLAKDAYFKKSSVEKYTAEDREEGLRLYLADLSKDYRNNKNEIFQIVEDTVSEILPIRVKELVKDFAEFRDVPQNTTIKFRVKNGKIKAVTVALGGHVRRQRIDQGSFIMRTEAVQAKVYEEYERVISGLVDWTSMINLVVDAIMETILVKVYDALISVYAKLPAVNKHTATTLDTAELDRIINVVKAYGSPVIMGTPVALSAIPLTEYASEADKLDIRNKGYLGQYKGVSCVELANSFEDASNTVKTLRDDYLFILPAGAEKIVKVATEGGTHIDDHKGADWTYNFEMYQKVGVAVYAVNNIGIYVNSSLA